LILTLDRDEHPRLLWMKIEVPWPKAEAGARRDRRLVREYAIVEAEDLERAGILGLALPGIVAARDEDCALVGRGGADLVRKDAAVGLHFYPGAPSAPWRLHGKTHCTARSGLVLDMRLRIG
jgi:hypothetical protein